MPDVSRAARVCVRVDAGNLGYDRLSFAPRWPRRQSARTMKNRAHRRRDCDVPSRLHRDGTRGRVTAIHVPLDFLVRVVASNLGVVAGARHARG
jgi:hypothetical protein